MINNPIRKTKIIEKDQTAWKNTSILGELLNLFPRYEFEKLSQTITDLSIMIREVVMERVDLIDILSLTALTIHKAKEPGKQLALFLPDSADVR